MGTAKQRGQCQRLLHTRKDYLECSKQTAGGRGPIIECLLEGGDGENMYVSDDWTSGYVAWRRKGKKGGGRWWTVREREAQGSLPVFPPRLKDIPHLEGIASI